MAEKISGGVLAVSSYVPGLATYGRKIVFLADPLLTDEQLAELGNTPYEILPNPLDTEELRISAISYLDAKLDTFGEKLAAKLNEMHGTGYSKRFWGLISYSWLLHWLHTSFDKYKRIEALSELYGAQNVAILNFGSEAKPPLDWSEFADKYFSVPGTLNAVYCAIAKELGLEEIILANPIAATVFKHETPDAGARNNTTGIKSMFKRALRGLIGSAERALVPYASNGKIFVQPNYFSRREQIRLALFSGWSFMKDQKKPGLSSGAETMVNRKVLSEVAGADNFEQLLVKMLPTQTPNYLCENFKALVTDAAPLSGFKVYAGWTIMYGNHQQCMSMALAREGGTGKIVDCQHGAGYGTFKSMAGEAGERRYADYFITWGWSDEMYPGAELVSLAQPNISAIADGFRGGNGNMLLVTTSTPPHVHRYYSYYLTTRDIFDRKMKFLGEIEPEIRCHVEYKPYSHEYDILFDAKLQKTFPEIKVHDGRMTNATQLMLNAELLVLDHFGTTFHYALAANVPTIMFYPRDCFSVRPEAEEYMEELVKVGILYHNPSEAAAAINRIWPDVSSWWRAPARQNARKLFAERFCRSSKEWMAEWTGFLSKIANELSDGN